MADTLRASIAKLIGKKPASLDPEKGVNVVRSWQTYLEGQGYTVKRYAARARVSGQHVILHQTADGTVGGVLSDSEQAGRVTPISRLLITKAAKSAGEAKAA